METKTESQRKTGKTVISMANNESNMSKKCPKCEYPLLSIDSYVVVGLAGNCIYHHLKCPDDKCNHRWMNVYRFEAIIDCDEQPNEGE